VRTQFGVGHADADRLVDLVEVEQQGLGDSARISALVAERYSAAQIETTVEEMWFLAFADQTVARREISLLEAVAKALHLEPDEVAAARRRAGVPSVAARRRDQGREDA
jgi:uncharacterized tellurite resistance protein B-like protein